MDIEYYWAALQFAGMSSVLFVATLYAVVMSLHLLTLIYSKIFSLGVTTYKIVGAHMGRVAQPRQAAVKT